MKETSADKLKLAIATLEEIRQLQRIELKLELRETFESLKPLNLIKNTIKNITESPDIRNNVIDWGLGIFSGLIAKKMIFRSSSNPVKGVAGVILQSLVTNLAVKNSDKIKSAGMRALGALLSLRKRDKQNFSESDNHE